MSTRLPLQSKAIRPKFQNKRAVFGNDDEDDERNHNDELVLGFEDNKLKEAEPKEEVKPLTISALPNADWRAQAKHKRELFVPAPAQQPILDTKPEVLTQNASSFGLQIQKKTVIQDNQETTETTVTVTEEKEQEQTPKTLEERAIEAIIKQSAGVDNDEEEEGSNKVIPVNETLSFRDDVENRPDETTMDDYENIPVDEFGAALLRGLGWNKGEGIGRNRKNAPAPPPTPVKQREALLGLGAKPEEVDKDQKHKAKRAAYEYKDTSLFKKISKRKYEDAKEDRSSSRGRRRDEDRHSNSSSRHSSSSRRDDDRYSNSSSRHSSSSRHGDRSSSSSSRKRYDDDYSQKRRRSRSSERHSSSSRSHSRRNSRSRSPVSRSSSSRHARN